MTSLHSPRRVLTVHRVQWQCALGTSVHKFALHSPLVNSGRPDRGGQFYDKFTFTHVSVAISIVEAPSLPPSIRTPTESAACTEHPPPSVRSGELCTHCSRCDYVQGNRADCQVSYGRGSTRVLRRTSCPPRFRRESGIGGLWLSQADLIGRGRHKLRQGAASREAASDPLR